MPSPRVVACPNCGKPVEWTEGSRWRPFCSERCKTIDLGAWASESYRIPTTPIEDHGKPDNASCDGDASQPRER